MRRTATKARRVPLAARKLKMAGDNTPSLAPAQADIAKNLPPAPSAGQLWAIGVLLFAGPAQPGATLLRALSDAIAFQHEKWTFCADCDHVSDSGPRDCPDCDGARRLVHQYEEIRNALKNAAVDQEMPVSA